MKKLSSKRAKACAISQKTKEKVFERDGGICIICGRPGLPEAHYIRRSAGGLGTEKNIFTACRRCHERFDNSTNKDERDAISELIREHFKALYHDWNEDDLVYKKYGSTT